MTKRFRGLWLAWAVLVSLLCAASATALETGLDVPSLLRRPGVKLVAVEFYADWCKPCMAAVPKWKALHEKYRAKGLHLVVVSVGEQGGCSAPGWNPDLMVCDLDTSIQKRLGANPLPQAFLWNWQGQLMASHADVSQVEAAIARYFAETPRILVSDAQDENGAAAKGGAALREQVRTELRKLAKFDLVASASEQATLNALRQKSHAAAYDEAGACAVGAAVSANSELKIKLLALAPGRRKLLLQLYSVEQGCLKAASDAMLQGADTETAVFTAVSSLVEQLIGKTANAVPLAAPTAPAQAQAAAGCAKDTDCKGERVCVKGECVEPAPKAPMGAPAAVDPAPATNKADIQWIYSQPAKLQFAKTETTVDQYAACVAAGKCDKPIESSVVGKCNYGHSARGNHPVNCVDWNQATAFCEWTGGRLPTEEEWAAEASNGQTRDYPWGNQEVSCDYAIWGEGNRKDGCGKEMTWPVCSKPKGNSVSGLCDMSGNVWEWTSSLYESGEAARVLRGGSWGFNNSITLRASGRVWFDPSLWYYLYGFRCVRPPR